ncbi:MAG: MATE family efflux transporter [Lachnospiraceae bacterium]|nr:MATE family efflux transporter [Lachnospiraceae bacterium]
MEIQLCDHFTYKKLLRFVLPSIVMMTFTSVYGVVDGLFVSNFVGTTAFAALNLVMPILMIIGAIGFMIGAGGTALVAKTLGEGKKEEANKYFSMFVYVVLFGGILLSLMGFLFAEPISRALGAEGDMLYYCILYCRICCISMPAYMLQNVFQSFFVTAEKPRLGLEISVITGVTNILLDYLFIVQLGWGLAGAAAATAVGEFIGGFVPFFYFIRKKNGSLLRLGGFFFDGALLRKGCTNGVSELMSNISASVITILYNYQLLRYAGENGVAAYGVMMYLSFIFVSIFMGYSVGMAPIVGYHYGSKDQPELKNLFAKSRRLILITGILLAAAAEIFARPLTSIFVGYDPQLFDMTCTGMRIFSISFLICGFNIFGSAFFTALNNGAVSAIISFLRTFVFQVVAIAVLPLILGLMGIWMGAVVTELMALFVTGAFFLSKRKVYGYL